MDKTGTLTEGKPSFERVVAMPGLSEDEVLRLAASLDQGSEHPLADAIVQAARAKELALDKPEDFESGSGIGVRGRVPDQGFFGKLKTFMSIFLIQRQDGCGLRR